MLRKLVSQTAIYGTSAIVAKFLNYLLTPYLTRIMSDAVYGQVTLLYALIPFANALLTMGMATAYFRWAANAQSQGEKNSIFSTLWLSVSGAAVLFFVIVTLMQTPISDVMGYGERTWYLVATAALIAIDNIAAIPLASLREQGRALRYTMVNVTGVVVNVAACWGLYTFVPQAHGVAGWVIVANLIASTVSLCMMLPGAWRMVVRKFNMPVFKEVLRYSMPLMVAGLMGVGGDFLDRQLLRWLLPEDIALAQVGIYGGVAKIAALMIIFRQIYTLGAEPFFLQKFSKEDFKKLNAQALKYFTIVGIVVFLSISLFSDLFGLILGRSFRVGMDVVPMLLMANLMMGILVNLSFWYKVACKTQYAVYVTVTGLATIVIVGCVTIPWWGYYGAAASHMVASMVMVGMSYYLNQKHYSVPYDMAAIGFYFLVGGIIFGLSYLTSELSVGWHYCANFLLLLTFIGIIIYREKLWSMLKSRL